MISLFSFLHTGTAFMVIVQFRGRLVRQYRACVIDSLGLGITCVLYHCIVCTRHPDLVSLLFVPSLYSNSTLEFLIYSSPSFLITIPNLMIILVSSNAKSSQKNSTS